MIEVELTYPEVIVAGQAGVLRQVNALKRRLNDPDADRRDPMEAHVSGAIVEAALAKALDLYWNPAIGITWAGEVDGDVGHVEVRSTIRESGRLLLHDYSFDDRPYVLALTHAAPTYRFVGWLLGAEGKRDDYWRADMPRSCYAIPQAALHGMDELPLTKGAPAV